MSNIVGRDALKRIGRAQPGALASICSSRDTGLTGLLLSSSQSICVGGLSSHAHHQTFVLCLLLLVLHLLGLLLLVLRLVFHLFCSGDGGLSSHVHHQTFLLCLLLLVLRLLRLLQLVLGLLFHLLCGSGGRLVVAGHGSKAPGNPHKLETRLGKQCCNQVHAQHQHAICACAVCLLGCCWGALQPSVHRAHICAQHPPNGVWHLCWVGIGTVVPTPLPGQELTNSSTCIGQAPPSSEIGCFLGEDSEMGE